ncbi:Endonuclease/Exonuclease/phosphatase family [seawater metagenome]|uniref:Endonuclease/Exonuclease/phosphatase family n=1 Tax=seawater metagenome TaxID=1561972 RepID=A0A5E8CKM7_9ZZZZ
MKRQFKFPEKKDKIRIVTYNILAPSVAENNSLHKISCKEECIKWFYRFELIKKEIMDLKPDIICLQEAQTSYVFKDIFPYFNSHGYQGYYIPQVHFRTSIKTEEDNFGIVILFNINKFIPQSIMSIDFHELVNKYLDDPKLLDRTKKRFCGLAMGLKDKKTNNLFFIISVHLEAMPAFEDIKNFQAYIVMKIIEKIDKDKNIPIVLCGDFNSIPSSSVYHGITTGKSINKFTPKTLKPYITTPSEFTKYSLKSCFKEIYGKEPRYTNYTFNFKDTLDYIFVNKKFKILDALNETIYENIGVSIPNKILPSDHFLQAADLSFI